MPPRSAAGRKFAKNRHKEQNKHVHDAEMSPEEALADVEQEAMSAFFEDDGGVGSSPACSSSRSAGGSAWSQMQDPRFRRFVMSESHSAEWDITRKCSCALVRTSTRAADFPDTQTKISHAR